MRLAMAARMLRALVLVSCTIAAQHAFATPAILPPLEVEYGTLVERADREHLFGRQLLIGLSWAAARPTTSMDVSAGLMMMFAEPDPAMDVRRDSSVNGTGAFVAVERAFAITPRYLRAWVGARGEYLGTDRRGVLGASLRVGVELWHGTEWATRGAGIIGSVGIALWAETGLREAPDGGDAHQTVAMGVGVRVPLMGVN